MLCARAGALSCGHQVYAIAFNNPYGDKVVTGSFDKTAKLWDAYTGQLYYTLRGHETEIVCLSFNPQSTLIATGSMDNTAKVCVRLTRAAWVA